MGGHCGGTGGWRELCRMGARETGAIGGHAVSRIGAVGIGAIGIGTVGIEVKNRSHRACGGIRKRNRSGRNRMWKASIKEAV